MSDSNAKVPPMPPVVKSAAPPSEIPTGPSPDKKGMTAGWNDPPKNIATSQSANPLRNGISKYFINSYAVGISNFNDAI